MLKKEDSNWKRTKDKVKIVAKAHETKNAVSQGFTVRPTCCLAQTHGGLANW